jgi:hypothetical protein
MKKLIAMLGCAALVAAGPALAQATKTIKGSVSAVGSNSVTVNVAGKDMTFSVDAKTTVVAKGAGTKAKAAEAAGKTGPGISEVVKTGDAVEVAYHEATMHADTVRGIASVPPPPPPPAPKDADDQKTKATTETGVVSAVNGNTVTVKGKAGDTTFTVDAKTVVSGAGFGTAGRKITDAGGKPTLGEFVHSGDTVTVTYHDTGVAKMASNVRVVKKALK